MRSKLTLHKVTMTIVAVGATAYMGAQGPATPRFLPDDPMQVDQDAALDAGGARKDDLGAYADFVINTAFSPADRRHVAALNVNTLDEVPDSSWFTNRIGNGAMTLDQIVRGPDLVERLEIDDWMIVAGKNTGRQAGFRAVSASDPNQQVFQIEFDPAGNPEMATGAEIIGTAIYHAIGYNVVDTYLIDLDPAKVTISPSATITVAGTTRSFNRRDLESIIRRAAKRPDGRYRATASRFAEGRNLGPFRYYGTRPGDANDIYPHEHRRELRANRVFCAWLNHDDSRAINSLDMLVGQPGQQYVKHYMFDFGSILGSGTNEEDHPWVGHEYLIEGRPALLTLASFGLWRRPYIRVSAPSDMPAAGNFTADRFVPERWKPHYPNPAFTNMQAADAFWAAKIVAAFSPEAIQGIVDKAQFSDPRVTDYVTGTLLRRREAVLRTWLLSHSAIANVRIDGDETLHFDNLAVDAGLTAGPSGYDVSWFRFDNSAGLHTQVADSKIGAAEPRSVPAHLRLGSEYIGVEIRGDGGEGASPVRAYFRKTAAGWQTVGLERTTDTSVWTYAQQ
jgi:hypothetical protein